MNQSKKNLRLCMLRLKNKDKGDIKPTEKIIKPMPGTGVHLNLREVLAPAHGGQRSHVSLHKLMKHR